MNWFLLIIISAGIGALLIFKWWLSNKSGLQKANQAIIAQKEKAKADILAFIKEKGQITNDDTQELLGISDATATRLLEELQKDGRVVQHGEAGRGVFYT